MKALKQKPIAGEEPLGRILRELGKEKAPGSLLPGVLSRVGLGDFYWHLESPIGSVFVASNRNGISTVMKANKAAAFERSFRARFGRPVFPAAQFPEKVMPAGIKPVWGRRRKGGKFNLEFLSDFERAVLLKTLEIPPGEVRPYGWVAREIGRPKAVRAVGTALSRNPIPLLIPCHRVVRSDGTIGDYAFGRKAKRAMLKAEGIDPRTLESKAISGERFYGSDTTRIFCFPTCRQARRISGIHRVSFKSEQEAMRAGYRPCKLCRPSHAPNAHSAPPS